jgi:hypothetical protein
MAKSPQINFDNYQKKLIVPEVFSQLKLIK